MVPVAFLDSPAQWAVVVIVALVLFGPDKLPDLMRQAARGVKEFRRYTSEFGNSFKLDELLNDTSHVPATNYPTKFDSYGNPIAQETQQQPVLASTPTPAPMQQPRGSYSTSPVIGDFAAPAMMSESSDTMASSTQPTVSIKPAENSVARLDQR